jgi:hypothetical protein
VDNTGPGRHVVGSASSDGHEVALSPRHTVTVEDDYFALIQRAPAEDMVVQTLARTMAGDTPLMTGELVIAGRATRAAHPMAATYPLHFRKTYYPGHLRGNPPVEFERHARASEVLGIAPPVGWSRGVFRSCLYPGRPFASVTPFGSSPEEGNIKHAEGLTLSAAAGLWQLSEQILALLTKLHDAGMTHGDALPQNFIVCYSPLEVVPIDFDMSIQRADVSAEEWQRRCDTDRDPFLKIAVFLQCALGAQQGPLAELSLGQMDRLLERAEPFRRAIAARARLHAAMNPVNG